MLWRFKMKVFRKILAIIIVSVMIPVILVNCNQNMISTSSQAGFRRPVKVGVVLHTFDPFMSLIRQNLEEIQKKIVGKLNLFLRIVRIMKLYKMRLLIDYYYKKMLTYYY